MRDEAACDDWLNLKFDPGKVDYATLIDKAFQRYIEALNAYVGDVAEHKTLVDGFEKWRRTKKTGRDGVFRIWPVAYYDRELCKRAFNLTPTQAAAHLKEAVERVDASKKGLLIVAARNVLPREEIARVDKRHGPLLISEVG